MKRILVADDHVLMREGILQLFSKHRAWAQSETITRQYLGSRVFNTA
jgi:DNA-binding NarL/FixJ family response regulator